MKTISCEKGFTLIEVVVAITLLAIGILAAATMQLSALRGNTQARQLTQAATWGQDQLETLMGKSYNDAEMRDKNNNGVNGLDHTDVGANIADGGPVNNGAFTVFWNIADDYPLVGCKTIRVHVRRNDQGVTKTISMDFTRLGPI